MMISKFASYIYNNAKYFLINDEQVDENTSIVVSDQKPDRIPYFPSSTQSLLAGHDPRNIEDAYKILNIELEERNERESITKKYDLVVISLNEKINDPRVPQPAREELKNALNNFNIAYQTICNNIKPDSPQLT